MTSLPSPDCRTPLHHWHVEHGARLVLSDSWNLPAAYGDAEQEIEHAQSAPGLADLSGFAKVSVCGAAVASISSQWSEDGTELRLQRVRAGRFLVCRLTREHLLLLADTTRIQPLLEGVAEFQHSQAVLYQDVTAAHAGFGLVGPHGDGILRRLTNLDIASTALPAGSCAESSLAGIHCLLVRPPGLLIPVTRIYVAWDSGEYVWDCLLESGRREGIRPIGMEAWQALTSGGG